MLKVYNLYTELLDNLTKQLNNYVKVYKVIYKHFIDHLNFKT